MKNFALSSTATDFVPASGLDNVLRFDDDANDVYVYFHSFLDGIQLENKSVVDMFERTMAHRVQQQIYTSTDHLITRVRHANTNIIYVSLDNSARAMNAGFPLSMRLENICLALNNVLKSCHDQGAIVIFSEACRTLAEGPSWFTLRQKIEQECGIIHVHEYTNNDVSVMSFGLAMFSTPDMYKRIEAVYAKRILTAGTGSVALGVRLINNSSIYWGIHFPLDFTEDENKNHNLATLRGLSTLMRDFKGSVCAIGDFNTIPGWLNTKTRQLATSLGMKFIVDENVRTFYGAFYDRAPIKSDMEIINLLDH